MNAAQFHLGRKKSFGVRCTLIYSHLLFRTPIRQCLFKKQVNLRVLSARWPFNEVKENRKIPHWDDHKVAAATKLRWSGWLMRVLFTIFYSQKLWDFNDWSFNKRWPLNRGPNVDNPTLYLKVRRTLNF